MPPKKSKIPDLLRKQETQLIDDWLREQAAATSARSDLMREDEVREQSSRFIRLLRTATQSGDATDIEADNWSELRQFLSEVSTRRAELGFSPTETATFILSFKQPLFNAVRAAAGADAVTLAEELWGATVLVDKLGLMTFDSYLRAREELIRRQQTEMLELSTPVVKLWEGVLALPMIGTLDSARTQVVMESLLQRIVETGSQIAILDITGVPTVDTLVAQHLLKTVAAARLMGAECIISGIRPQIAQTMVHLAIDLNDIITKATLADAFVVALQKIGADVAGKGRQLKAPSGDAARR